MKKMNNQIKMTKKKISCNIYLKTQLKKKKANK